ASSKSPRPSGSAAAPMVSTDAMAGLIAEPPAQRTQRQFDLSMKELEQDVRPDGTWRAGKLWDGVWTRDISYAIYLGLARIDPKTAKASLMAKVADGKIIQDTGTGGSWPISTDRTTWGLAAWEVYKATGDQAWLATAFKVLKDTVDV